MAAILSLLAGSQCCVITWPAATEFPPPTEHRQEVGPSLSQRHTVAQLEAQTQSLFSFGSGRSAGVFPDTGQSRGIFLRADKSFMWMYCFEKMRLHLMYYGNRYFITEIKNLNFAKQSQ